MIPTYSIVIPVYNAEKYLDGCMQSVLMQRSGSKYEIILVNDGSVDRSAELCDRYAAQLPCVKVIHQTNQGVSAARNAGISASNGRYILFLDADTETLISRYKETRRDHPLMRSGQTLEASIAKERELLQPLRERANYVLSTTGMRAKSACACVDELLSQGAAQQTLRTEIMSFGYKRGIPRESDLVFDVRFLPNPFYIKEIRAYTGLEAPIRDYVLGKEETHAFLAHMYTLVDYLIPLYRREGKRRLMIAIGCTGGAHRSVAISEALGAHLRALGQSVNVTHRDIALEEASWPFRRDQTP